eukprot:272309_1
MGQEASHLPSISSYTLHTAMCKTQALAKPNDSSTLTHSLSESTSSVIDLEPQLQSLQSVPHQNEKVHNGVTGVYVSHKLVDTMRVFWQKNVDCLSLEDRLEIGSSIYFNMVLSSKEMKRILWNSVSKDRYANVKRLGLRFFDMIGWLIRRLSTHSTDLKDILTQLGTAHKALGIKMSDFSIMLTAVHEAFDYYFAQKYTMKERYAIDKLFTVTAELMMNEDMHSVPMMNDGGSLTFLNSISDCLDSQVGKAYLYRHFHNTACDELVIYLESIRRYKAATSDKQRFMIGRDICKTSIQSTAQFAINISHEAREDTLDVMVQLEAQFFKPCSSQSFDVPITLFDQSQNEILRLIKQNHWVQFKREITNLL